ncbi:MAG TPA: molybdate ABC transporter substrate-binding protein [Mycobacteriales bacterium]|nr:molybdate ABC transporter substrate-binding protein [Mycobacteriales bacterium]
MTPRPPALAALTLSLALTACGSGAEISGAEPITVFAAASLTEAFSRIGADFEEAHPGSSVVFSFAASSTLAQQILAGAPADVFAAASPVPMTTLTRAGRATAPTVFVRNRLQIAVPPGNHAQVRGLSDFTRPSLKIALCAPQVPCGAATEKAFNAAGLVPEPDTLEQDVKAVLAKVTLGEVDAALVYRTDVLAAAGVVDGIAFPEADKAVNDYFLATTAEAPNAAGGSAFVDYVLSARGQRVLDDAGFDPVT